MDTIMKYASKVGSQRHLGAIRDGFVALMPLLIVGSIVTLLNQIPAIINEMFGTAFQWPSFISTINGNIWWGTFDMIGLIGVVTIAHSLAKYYDTDRLAASIVALASYLSIVPQTVDVMSGEETVSAWGNISRQYTNAQGLFVGILVALLAVELFVRLKESGKLEIKMPDGVPPAVGRSFSALLPGVITVAAITVMVLLVEWCAQAVMGLPEPMNIFALINRFVSIPLLGVADTLGYALVVVLLSHILWFFGLHGTNIIEGIIQPISLQMMERNAQAFAAGERIPHIVTKPFLDAFVYIGGAGTVLGLLLAIFLVGRAKQHRTVAQLSIAPSLFNINEPVIFGLPIVLNPVLVIPFIASPCVLAVISYFAVSLGLVPGTVAIIPWATPPIISGFLVTGGAWQGAALQIVNIAVSVLIYLPFVKVADRVERKKEMEQEVGE